MSPQFNNIYPTCSHAPAPPRSSFFSARVESGAVGCRCAVQHPSGCTISNQEVQHLFQCLRLTRLAKPADGGGVDVGRPLVSASGQAGASPRGGGDPPGEERAGGPDGAVAQDADRASQPQIQGASRRDDAHPMGQPPPPPPPCFSGRGVLSTESNAEFSCFTRWISKSAYPVKRTRRVAKLKIQGKMSRVSVCFRPLTFAHAHKPDAVLNASCRSRTLVLVLCLLAWLRQRFGALDPPSPAASSMKQPVLMTSYNNQVCVFVVVLPPLWIESKWDCRFHFVDQFIIHQRMKM